MSQNRLSPKLIAGIILALFFGVALYLRIALPYDEVFGSDWIKFTGVDAYYHMRLVDNLVHHFPHRIAFDPYTFYPHGTAVSWPPFFDWLIAGVAWLVGFGSPTQHAVDVVGVYFPTILGALTVIPVYFIGKALFNRWAGVIAAGLIAVLPSEFLGRSILGFADHHVAEALFTTITMLFLILAVKSAKQKELTFNHLKHRDWPVIARPLIYSLLCGVFLGIYLLSWVGGLLFVFIIFVYFIMQFIIDHLRGESTDYLGIIGTLSFLVAMVITLPLLPQTWPETLSGASLSIAMATPLVLSGISRLMTRKRIRPAYYPLAAVGSALAGLAILHAINPSQLKSMLGSFGIFMGAGGGPTVLETQPLLFPAGSFSLSLAWTNFTTGFFLSFISLGILVYFIVKRGEADKTLLVVWSLMTLAATLAMRRFGYYFAVNVALLTSYLSWLILQFGGFKEAGAEPTETPENTKKESEEEKTSKGGFRLAFIRANMALSVIAVVLLVFCPSIGLLRDRARPAVDGSSQGRFAPSDAWCESLSWLRDNTPDPFGNPDFYYELYEPPPGRQAYDYPESAYGVLAWWDYGHWITRVARRIPVANPFIQGVAGPSRFFTAQDETSANRIMDELGSKYVIIDHATTMSKLYDAARSAGGDQEEFDDVYYQTRQGKLVPQRFYYPQYYRSLAVRLYSFDDAIAGTTGQRLRMGAIKIRLVGAPSNLHIYYRAYVQNIGWQDWVCDGAMAGTTGQSLRIEALEIKLVEDVSGVNYEAHVQNTGWQSQVQDGQTAGTTGQALRIEAMKINVPGYSVGYEAHVQNIGWQGEVFDDAIAGTTGQRLRMGAIKIRLVGAPSNLHIYYRAYVQNIGWQDWVCDGAMAGTTGQSLRIEALEIKLVEDVSGVNYEAHVQNTGWQSQVQDGQTAGTTGQALRIEAMKINVPGYSVGYEAHVQNIGWQGEVFDGSPVVPRSSTVVSFAERVDPHGVPYKEITSSQSFPTYEEAEAYVSSQESGDYRIVGTDPFISPVPLEALEEYKLIYSSSSTMQTSIGMTSEVKIFEYVRHIRRPTVVTTIVENITNASATLKGELTDLATAAEVTLSFLWGPTEACENETSIVVDTATGGFARSLSGLSPGTTYYYKAKAVGDGTSYGVVKSFTTTASED